MFQNFSPIETLSSHFNQQPLNQSQASITSHRLNNSTLIEPSLINLTNSESTSPFVSNPSPVEVFENDKEPMCYITEVPCNDLLQYITVSNLVELPGDENSINYIQIPNTVNVIQLPSNLLVAINNLVLCLPPEGISLQLQQSQVSNVEPNESSEPNNDFILIDRAKHWHKDSNIVNQALLALNNDITSNSSNCKLSDKET